MIVSVAAVVVAAVGRHCWRKPSRGAFVGVAGGDSESPGDR